MYTDEDNGMAFMLFVSIAILAQDTSPPQDCVERYRARLASIENIVVASKWQDSLKGRPIRRDYQTLIEDNLRRRRLKMTSEEPASDGNWVRNKNTPYDWDFLYDGQITANMTFDPRKDRVGKDLKPGETGGYHTVQISDGHWEGLKNQRTPLQFATPSIDLMEAALQNKQTIETETLGNDRMAFRVPGKTHDDFVRIEVDLSRDMVPLVLEQQDAAGNTLMVTKMVYAETPTGAFYIKNCKHSYFGDQPHSETPLRETVFEVTECKINDPEFSEDHFRYSLGPDTAVQDLRFGVLYRTGETVAVTERLTALANAAIEQKKKDEEAERGKPFLAPIRNYVLWINLLAIAALIGVTVWKQRKRDVAA
jgi:hypothetical protein